MERIRKVVRSLRTIKNKDLCLWLVPGRDGRVKKVKIGMLHAGLGGVAMLAALAGVVYVGVDYSKFISTKNLVENLLKKSPSATDIELIGDDSFDALVTQIRFISDEHKKNKEYEAQVRQRLNVLRSSLESGVKMELFDEYKDAGNDKDIGGAELDCTKGGTGCLARGTDSRAGMNWNFSSLLSSRDEDLINQLDRYIQILQKMPITRPVVGWVNSSFGPRISPFSKKLTNHQGIDFSVPYNSPVYASADGVVKSVVKTKTYGLMVDIKHSNRVNTRYAHLSKAVVKVGDKVCRGEMIALSGSSGRSTGPHLHFEVQIDGKQVDPSKFLSIGSNIDSAIFNIK